ncbi:MAG: 30S ribosomal protein S18 [Chitinivibrionales bacterium]|nr:30S ribosomal protein S18 [Chitinivibrionales bacterium]
MAGRNRRRKKKVCFFCTHSTTPCYKKEDIVRRMVTERGKIMPRRMTGTCARHQRSLATAIKRARYIAMLPFVSENMG